MLIASQKPSGSGLVKMRVQLLHPSVVSYRREEFPLPVDMTIAVFSSNAWIPRKSRSWASRGVTQSCQRIRSLPFGVLRRWCQRPSHTSANREDASEIGGRMAILHLPLRRKWHGERRP